jgi:hypothetical protein
MKGTLILAILIEHSLGLVTENPSYRRYLIALSPHVCDGTPITALLKRNLSGKL